MCHPSSLEYTLGWARIMFVISYKWNMFKLAKAVGATDEGGIKFNLMDDKGPLRQRWRLRVFTTSGRKKSSGSALDLLFCGPDLCVVDLFHEKKHQQRGHFHRLESLLALVAKRNEQSDSLRWAASGERFKNIFSG
jgi:hypothetical protein